MLQIKGSGQGDVRILQSGSPPTQYFVLLLRFTLYVFRLLLSYSLLFLVIVGSAQTRKRNYVQRELGFFGGGSYYIGDINPRGHFKDAHAAGGIFFRYSPNYRFSYRFGFNYGQISGDDATSGEPDQIERNLNFRSKLYEFHINTEFNFVEYRIGHDRYKFTFFIFAGIAGFNFNPVSNTDVPLRELTTEGQSAPYPKNQLCLPFGVGLKWNMGEKVGMGIEWGPRRTFTDYLDDIRSVYPEFPGPQKNPAAVSGNMRGNPSTRDWYFYYGVTLNIKLRDPHRSCHKEF